LKAQSTVLLLETVTLFKVNFPSSLSEKSDSPNTDTLDVNFEHDKKIQNG
jgi:hypothetical protein